MSKYDWMNELDKDDGFEQYRLKGTDVTREFKRRAYRLAIYLKEAMERKVTNSKFFEHHFGVSGSEVRKMIRWLRFDGYPIGSTSKGYFYAHDLDRLDSTIKHMIDRARADVAVAMSLRETQAKRIIKAELQEMLF